LGKEDTTNVVDFSLELIKVDAVSSVQECNDEFEIFMRERSAMPRFMGKGVIGDAIATIVGQWWIYKSLLETKEIAYLLYIVALSLESWNSCLEVLWDWVELHDEDAPQHSSLA
jgi:hypothetical protein